MSEKDRLRSLEARVESMMEVIRVLRHQVIVLTQRELTRTEGTDPVDEIKARISRAERQERMEKHPIFGYD